MKILKLPLEIWKDIPDLPFQFEGDYEISNHGRVRYKPSGIILAGTYRSDPEGWKRVFLTKRRRAREMRDKIVVARVSVHPHRLVWDLFGDEPRTTKRHIYHINKCKKDNYIWNLALTGKRAHKRRIARWKKEGVWVYKRPRRYWHDRTQKK